MGWTYMETPREGGKAYLDKQFTFNGNRVLAAVGETETEANLRTVNKCSATLLTVAPSSVSRLSSRR